MERERAFGVISQALEVRRRSRDPERAALAAAIGSVAASEAAGWDGVADRRHRILEAIVDLLEEWASRQPVALIVDDLQWCDDASLMTLGRVAGLTRVLPVALIAALRGTPRTESLAAFLRVITSHEGRWLTIDALDAAASDELVTLLAGRTPGPRLVAMTRKCAGNPLFVRELLETLSRERLLESAQGCVELTAGTAPSAPPALTMLILRHLSVLPPPTLEVVRIAAVLGSVFSVEDLSVVTGRPATELLAALGPARAAGVLVESEAGLAFQHDLVREALYEDLGTSLRRALHRQVADALMDAGAAVGRVAVHSAAAAEPGDATAARVLFRAGCDAAVRDPVSAASLLEQAAAIADSTDAVLADIELKLGQALLAAGRIGQSKDVLKRLIDRVADGRVRTLARSALVDVLHTRAEYEEKAAELKALTASPFLTEAERARVFAMSVNSRAWSGEAFHTQDNDASRALALGRRLHDACTQYWALSAHEAVARYAGRMSAARDYALESARVLSDVDTDPEAAGFPQPPLVGALIVADCFDEAIALLDTPAWRGERGRFMEPFRQWHTMRCELHRGRWSDAVAAGETAMTVASESGAPQALGGAIEPILAVIHARCGDIAHASSLLARPTVPVQEEEHLITFANAYVTAARGDSTGARRLVANLMRHRREEYGGPSAWGTWTQTWRDFGGALVQLTIALGDLNAARVVTDDLQTMAQCADVISMTGLALLSKAMVSHDADGMLAAVAVLRTSPRVVDLALACEEAGAASGSAPLLTEALQLYERFGAWRDVARTRSRMRACGIRSGPRGPRQRPTTGYASLTPTEQRVAELVAAGLLYKEVAERLYVSRRTVETHVVHVFAKLGVASRLELTRAIQERETRANPH